MQELERIGADASRLGGSRHRCDRFGYEGAGTLCNFTFFRWGMGIGDKGVWQSFRLR